MNLQATKSAYFAGQMSKVNYIDAMYQHHQHLFEYADFIGNTEINKIEITDKEVIVTSKITGVKIHCDRYDKRLAPFEILNFNSYEKSDFDMLFKLLTILTHRQEQGINFFDIGANIGWYTINMAKVFEQVKFFAFEPVPMTFQKLKANVGLNNLSNVTINNFGLSNEEKELTFYYYPEGSGNASSANLSESANVETIPCFVKKLDDFAPQHALKVDFIKCDVEGAELLVYQGGFETIKKDRPIIFTELLRKWSAKFNYHPNAILDLLFGLGYRCFTVKNEQLFEFFTIDENTLETNFFFLHSVQHAPEIDSLLIKS